MLKADKPIKTKSKTSSFLHLIQCEGQITRPKLVCQKQMPKMLKVLNLNRYAVFLQGIIERSLLIRNFLSFTDYKCV